MDKGARIRGPRQRDSEIQIVRQKYKESKEAEREREKELN